MKHILVRGLAIGLAVCLVGCSAPASSSASQAVTQSVSQPVSSSVSQAASSSSEEAGIVAKTDALTAEITIAADMFEDLGTTVEEYMASAREGEGFIDIKQNDDGSVTLTLEKQVYDSMVEEMRTALNALFPMEDFPSIKSIESNDDVSKINLVVDQKAYEEGSDSIAMLTVYMSLGYYQVFAGTPAEKVVITVTDEASGTVFETIHWPEDLNTEAQE